MFLTHTVREPLNSLKEQKNNAANIAKSKGLVYGYYLYNNKGYGAPALGGNTYSVKETLKQFGAKFKGDSKVWAFDSFEQLNSALAAI
jgi:hypothetical protein